MCKFVCILSIFFLALVYQSMADITDTECDPGNGGEATCKAADSNALCTGDTAGTKHCECKENYFFSTDKTKCEQKITTVTCDPAHATNGNTKCQQVDANALCKTGDTTCTCKKEYKGTDSCTKVLGGTCDTAGDCTGSVDNSVCSADDKCECAANYIEENAVCKTALGKECSGTGQSTCVSNAECADNECKCLSGFKDTNGLCAAESSATSAWLTSSLLVVTSMLIYLPKIILW